MLIAAGCVSCQPTLEPPTGHFCPEVNVTYSCHDSQVMAMAWFAEPYFSGNQGIKYAPGFTTNVTRKRGDYFYTQATSFSVDMEKNMFLSVTTTLTVITSGLENGTNITCLTTRGGGSSILYFAGNGLKIIGIASHILAAFLLLDVPHWKNMSKIFLENNATATIELGDMFYGGGFPIVRVPGSYMRLLTGSLYKTVYFLTVSFTGCFMCIANNDVMKRSSSSS